MISLEYRAEGIISNRYSPSAQNVMFIGSAPRIQRADYTIHAEYHQLFTEKIISDLSVCVLDSAHSGDFPASFSLKSHSSIVSMYSKSLTSSITWARNSSLPGSSETTSLVLDSDVCKDISSIGHLMHYMYSGTVLS